MSIYVGLMWPEVKDGERERGGGGGKRHDEQPKAHFAIRFI